MLETKLIKGRYIDLPANLWPKGVGYNLQNAGDFMPIPLKLFNLTQSVRSLRGKHSATVQGVNPKIHRNFQWLTYYPYRVTHVPLIGMDVLTGWMGGCRVIVYRDGSGVHVAHVGTEVDVVKNTATKNAWNQFAQGPHVGIISGFNPWARYDGNSPAARAGEEGKCLALVTTDYRLYSAYVFRQPGTVCTFRIAEIEEMPSLSPHQLQNLA